MTASTLTLDSTVTPGVHPASGPARARLQPPLTLTLDPRSRIEAEVVNAAVWGAQARDLLPELTDALAAGLVTDPWCAAVLVAVVAVAAEVDSLTPGALALAVHAHLVAAGVHREQDFGALVLAEVEPGTLHALPWLLHRLAEAAKRRRLLARLVALADTLERPDGPARVAEALGVMA